MPQTFDPLINTKDKSTADSTTPLPDVILDALAELYWDERINHPAIAALRA